MRVRRSHGFAAFAGLLAISAAIDPTLADGAPDIPQGVIVAFFAFNILGVATTVFVVLQYFVRARERALSELADQHEALGLERAKSERLLLNVLPEPVAARLKEQEGILADDHPAVTVLFADLVGFTPLAGRVAASELVSLLDRVFASWDALAAKHGVEKIKTIGDAYMVAGGIPLSREDHAEAIADMALAMGPELARLLGRDRDATPGADRHRQRPRGRGGDRPRQVQLRPVGRHGQHREPDGVPRRAGHHPGDRERRTSACETVSNCSRRGSIEVKGKGALPSYLLIARLASGGA